MSMLKIEEKVYDDGLTKQSFRDQCDVNKIIAKAQKAGGLSHLDQYEGVYADFANYDFEGQQEILARGSSIFADLPSSIRAEFGNQPSRFFEYVNDPANAGNLRDIFPELAKPGLQLPNPVKAGHNSGAAGPTTAPPSGASEPQASVPQTTEVSPGSGPEAAPAASPEGS